MQELESKEDRLNRIEAHLLAQTCSICGKHLDYADGCYTVTHSHYACAYPNGYKSFAQQFKENSEKMDACMGALGIKPKRRQAKIGEGSPTKRLKEIIEVSAKEHFGTEAITDINVYLPPPVWRQHRFDVRRVEGSMRVDGRTVTFGSWSGVTELVKYRRVTWDDDWPAAEMNPLLETRRTRIRVSSES